MSYFKNGFTKGFLFLICFLFLGTNVFAEYYNDEKNGYAIDFVDGFKITEQTKNGIYLTSDFLPVEFVVNVYDKSRFKNATQSLEFASKQLRATDFSCDKVKWRNTDCAIANFSFDFQGTQCTAWAVSVLVKESKKIIVVLGYTAQENDAIYEKIILSSLDSIFIDNLSYRESGIVTTFVFPKESTFKRNVQFKGVKTEVHFDKSDENADKYVVEREYAILELLSETDFWYSTWQRFYQTIYRNSFSRIKNACYTFCNELYANGFSSETDADIIYAQNILDYVQQLPYSRNQASTDFTNLCSTFLGSASDCDSRSILAAILLNMMNIKSTVFVSIEYSHAMVGAALNADGAKIAVGDVQYLLGETTAKVNFGKIAQDMSDTSKWFNIELP